MKLEVPAVVGMPLIAEPLRVSPAGKLPWMIDQLYGVVPPVPERSWLYDVPTIAIGSVDVASTNAAGFTTMLIGF